MIPKHPHGTTWCRAAGTTWYLPRALVTALAVLVILTAALAAPVDAKGEAGPQRFGWDPVLR